MKTTTKSLIPNILTQKSNSTVPQNKREVPLPSTLKKIDPKPLINEYSDESDIDDVETDFFSIYKPEPDLPVDDTPLEIHDKVESKKPFNIESYFKKDSVDSQMELQPEDEHVTKDYTSEGNSNQSNIESENNDVVLDEEAVSVLNISFYFILRSTPTSFLCEVI